MHILCVDSEGKLNAILSTPMMPCFKELLAKEGCPPDTLCNLPAASEQAEAGCMSERRITHALRPAMLQENCLTLMKSSSMPPALLTITSTMECFARYFNCSLVPAETRLEV